MDKMGHLQTEVRSGTSSSEVRARLGSWKEIAAFFEKDVRTVRRWEAERSLPVHRIPGGQRGGVYAYISELQDWLTRSEESPAERSRTETQADQDLKIGQQSESLEAMTEAPVEPTTWLQEVSLESATPEATTVDKATLDAEQKELSPQLGVTKKFSTAARLVTGLALLAMGIVVGLKLEQTHRRDVARASSASGTVLTSAGRPSADPEAQELYLRGLYLWNQRTEASLRESVRLFQQAIAHDPQFAAAYAGLADSYILLRQYGHMADSKAFPLALIANQTALKLDDSSPEAHRTNAFLLNYWIWDFPAAEREFAKTLALRPSDAQAHHWYATSLYSVGRYQDAMREIDTARRLQPDSISVLANRGLLLTPIDANAAYTYLQQLERVNPTFASVHAYLSYIEETRGDYAAFLNEQRLVHGLRQDDDGVKLIDAAAGELKVHGEAAMYSVLADGSARAADAGRADALPAAAFYAHLQDDGRTLHYLKLACDRHEASFVEVNQNPIYRRLSTQPEFQALMIRRRTPLPLTLAGLPSSYMQKAPE